MERVTLWFVESSLSVLTFLSLTIMAVIFTFCRSTSGLQVLYLVVELLQKPLSFMEDTCLLQDDCSGYYIFVCGTWSIMLSMWGKIFVCVLFVSSFLQESEKALFFRSVSQMNCYSDPV